MKIVHHFLFYLFPLFNNYNVFSQKVCTVTFSQYEQISTNDSTKSVIDLVVRDNKGKIVFEWPEVIGESIISGAGSGYEITCFGNTVLPIDSEIIYNIIPYCKMILDTNTCSIQKTILIDTSPGHFDSITLIYNSLKNRLGGAEEARLISKKDEVKLIQLCFTITFAIINGCDNYLPLFLGMKKDFSIFIYGLDSVDYMSCKASIEVLLRSP